MKVPKEVHTTSLLTLRLLNKLACALVLPERGPETCFHICFVVFSHDFLDMDRSFAGVVEWNCGDKVVADVRSDNVVEEVRVDEAEVTIDGCGGSAGEGPGSIVVVGHAGIGVLEEGDCDCRERSVLIQK